MALFIVLWALVLLTVIAAQFCLSMRNEANMTANFKNRVEARYLAEAGFTKAVAELLKPRQEEPNDVPADAGEEPAEPTEWRVNTENPELVLGNGKAQVFIGNESGKVDVNTADAPLLSVLLNGFPLEKADKDVIIDSILDWRDKDDLVRLNGAENNYYRSLPEPYDCRNGKFSSIEELLLVRGVTEALFRGGLETMVTLYSEASSQVADAEPRVGSIFAKPKNKTAQKATKININAASETMLLSLPLMTEDLAAEVLDFRKTRDFKSLSEFQSLVGGSVFNALGPYVSLTASRYYSIRSVGTIDGSGSRSTIDAVVFLHSTGERKFSIVKWKDGGY
jgi:general secretion pathway protein K